VSAVLHAVLERQLRKVGAEIDAPTSAEQWRALLARISQAYVQADQERYTLERSIAISSQEMQELNARLATERDRLYVTIASMADGLCVLDGRGLIEIANPAAERLLGAEPGKLSGKDFGDLVSGAWPAEDERASFLNQLRGAIRTGGSCRYHDARFMTLKREWLPVSFALTPIGGNRTEEGRVIIFSDIRARKAAEDALRQSESRFRAIFESAAVGIVGLQLDGRIADCNRTFSEMLGCDRAALLGQSVFTYIHPDEVPAACERFEKLKLQGSAGTQVERRYVHRDGSTVWTMHAMSFVRDPEGAPVFAIGVVENVTDRKRLEGSLRQAQKLEAVGQLAAGIAHEINTPVQFVSDSVHFIREAVADLLGVLGRYRVLRDAAARSFPELCTHVSEAEEEADVEYLAEQLPKALDRALDGLSRVATIVRGMKSFAHPDEKEKAAADLNHALHATLAISRNEYKYVADVETEFGDLPPVICHVGELNQVFLNIIVNAAHAIGDVVRGTESKGRIRVKTWRDGDSALVAISDTGSGIPEEVRHRIFDPFFTTKEVGRGTGQGLSIARAVVVEKHQGELTFQTEIGHGTTFVIKLPIEPRHEGARAA
jgi:PAS domain S-box-containing protein